MNKITKKNKSYLKHEKNLGIFNGFTLSGVTKEKSLVLSLSRHKQMYKLKPSVTFYNRRAEGETFTSF